MHSFTIKLNEGFTHHYVTAFIRDCGLENCQAHPSGKDTIVTLSTADDYEITTRHAAFKLHFNQALPLIGPSSNPVPAPPAL